MNTLAHPRTLPSSSLPSEKLSPDALAMLDALKLFAMACMVFDHATWFYALHHHFATVASMIAWRTPGRFSMPLFAFIVGTSGALLTSDLRKMVLRLTLFAVISQPLYNLYFGPWDGLNAIWSLALGAWMLSWTDPRARASMTAVDHGLIAWVLGALLVFWAITSSRSMPLALGYTGLRSDVFYALAVPWVGFFVRRGVLTRRDRVLWRTVFAAGFLVLSVQFNSVTLDFFLVMMCVAGLLWMFPVLSSGFAWRGVQIKNRMFFYYFYPVHIALLYLAYKI